MTQCLSYENEGIKNKGNVLSCCCVVVLLVVLFAILFFGFFVNNVVAVAVKIEVVVCSLITL